MSARQNFTIWQGKTFTQVLRWEIGPIVYKAISAITNAAPASITATAHGVPNGWRVLIVSVKGMTEINAVNVADWHEATVVDVNTITLNDVNSSDFSTYVSGGYVQYNTPKDLTGYTARMTVKDRIGGDTLLSLTTDAGGGITLSTTDNTITIVVSATDTAAFTWNYGVYDLEMVSSEGEVTGLLSGEITVTPEVTT